MTDARSQETAKTDPLNLLMKFAFVSQGLPPFGWGQSIATQRLLSGLNPEDYCLIEQDYGKGKEYRKKETGRLLGRYYYLSSFLEFRRGWRFSLVRWVNTISRALKIARVVKREGCAAIVACPGDFFDLPAAYLASCLTKVKFYPYMFDYYSQQAADFKGEEFAKKFEAKMMRDATCVIAPNEFIRDELQQRYKVNRTAIVRNACDVAQYEVLPLYHTNRRDEFNIVYTGSLYLAHFDAFRNLISAIELLNQSKGRDVKLHLYTNQAQEQLDKNGIRGPIIFHGAQDASAVPSIQRQADLLFLPLAFSSPYPELIRTSAPGKTGEYLASGRPILVHAPADSFLAWYFHRNQCGLVVDDSSPVKLAQAIEQVVKDPQLEQRLTRRAWERANSDFSIPVAQAAFAHLLEVDIEQG